VNPTSTPGALLRLAAFTADPAGGNPAGVWIGDVLPPADEMQRIAAEVGYSETAFLAPLDPAAPGTYRVRYFSPLAEVPFCGHATIASGVALAERGAPHDLSLRTNDGEVRVEVGPGPDGRPEATLTSVAASIEPAPEPLVEAVLGLVGWSAADLDPALAPAVAFAGAKHLVFVAGAPARLDNLDYPFAELQRVMLDADLTTVALMARTGPERWRARDPFPVGGVVEDPATGAAAAAFGGYLRDRGVIAAPASFVIDQGAEMGRPSRLTVSIVAGDRGVRVTGSAVAIPDPGLSSPD
jgi:PhzF family phenazine biosynthesis protein